MVDAKRWVRAGGNLSQGRVHVPGRGGRRPRTRIIGMMAVVLFLGGTALGEFMVQPIILKKQVQRGQHNVPLDFKIENLSADSPTMVSLRIVDLAKDANGIWTEVPPRDPNDEPDASALPSCRDWLTCPVRHLVVDPCQVVVVPMTANIPPGANGFHFAALIVTSAPRETEIDGFTSTLTLQYLVPIILEAQTALSGQEGAAKPPPAARTMSDASAPSRIEVSGRVIDPNGKPVTGARVGLNTRQLGQVMLRNAILEPRWPDDEREARFVDTDGDGRFRFEGTWSHPFYLFATHVNGFGAVTGKDFQKNHEMRLEQWGRIEGQLATGHRGTDGRVWMQGLPGPAPAASQCGLLYDAPCDADGRFVFEQVPAGWFNVGYLMPLGDNLEALTARTAVVVKAGETARVKVGGGGRPVIGRFVLPASYDRPARFGTGLCILRRFENIERGKMLQLSEEQLENDPYAIDARIYDLRTDSCVTSVEENGREWYIPWQVVDDYVELVGNSLWNDTDWREYAFRVGPDGSFRVEDVVPGRYELSVSLAERRAGEGFLSPFAQYHGTIEVPPMSERHPGQPFDVGTLTLNTFGVGDSAPLFEGETFDVRPVRLTDYRGRFVLLSFWGSGPEHPGLLDRLKELHRTYGDRGDFQIIVIGHEPPSEDMNAPATGNQIQFIVYGPDGFFERLPRQYHLFGRPDMVLIDPQGKIAATHLWGPDGGARLMRTVREEVEPIPAPTPKSND